MSKPMTTADGVGLGDALLCEKLWSVDSDNTLSVYEQEYRGEAQSCFWLVKVSSCGEWISVNNQTLNLLYTNKANALRAAAANVRAVADRLEAEALALAP